MSALAHWLECLRVIQWVAASDHPQPAASRWIGGVLRGAAEARLVRADLSDLVAGGDEMISTRLDEWDGKQGDQKYFDALSERQWGGIDHPFEATLIVGDASPAISPLWYDAHASRDTDGLDVPWRAIGLLLVREDDRAALVARGPGPLRKLFSLRDDGCWSSGALLTGLDAALPTLLARLTPPRPHRGRAAHRRAVERRARKLGVRLPRVFYEVLPKAPAAPSRPPGGLDGAPRCASSFRHDRIAHWRLLVRRGVGALSATERAALERPRSSGVGYRVVAAGEPLPADVRGWLTEKGHRLPAEGEWVAALRVRVRSAVVGAEGLPYIPAMRPINTDEE